MTGYWDIHNHILPGVDDGSGYLLALMMFVLLVATRKKWIPELRKGKKV